MKQKTLFIIALASLLLAFAGGVLLYSTQAEDQTAQMPETQRAALVRMHSPSLGNSEAPVVIVEFLDPACGTCRAFYPLVKKMMAENPDRIRLVLRHAPFHSGSDKVAAMLEAARKQDKFWPALEAVLAAQNDWVINHVAQPALVWKHLEGLGLNIEQMKIDMNAPEIANIIAQDVADARTLDVKATPEFFVNGRPLPSFGYEQLKKLVDDALKQAQRR